MAFDGITIFAVCRELGEALQGGRIDKIYQPDDHEIILQMRRAKDGGGSETKRLLLTTLANSPRLHLTERRPENPLQPPMFCMLLRKHLSGARLLSIDQYHADRIVELTFEALDELGDPVKKRLILEIMGKHSNLFLVDESDTILDALHHVGVTMSSVRQVLPGLPYALPVHSDKWDPFEIRDLGLFRTVVSAPQEPLYKALYLSMNGFSPFLAREILARAGIDENTLYPHLAPEAEARLFTAFTDLLEDVTAGRLTYTIYREGARMVEFSIVSSVLMQGAEAERYDTLSALLDVFYQQKDTSQKIRQKAQDLSKLISNNLDRARRKARLQEKQLADTQGREVYRVQGELITANIYQLKKGMKSCRLPNFYEEDQPLMDIRLDENLTPAQNAQKLFDRYNKLKRTEAALQVQLKQTYEEIEYLESIESALALSDQERDLENLRQELHETGYIRRVKKTQRNLAASKPLEFTTSEGVKVWIGKNNIQNEQLTFRTAQPNDLWLHVKDVPGSHTILFLSGLSEGTDYTDKSLLEAAQLAAAHSKAAAGSQVPVDYTLRRYVKKPSGARPGYVIYTHQKTLYVTPASL
ncbi:MAG: NFACT family protein [Clostridiales bacterium]|nr:NFACT family protein [Clostridiales bacterium]